MGVLMHGVDARSPCDVHGNDVRRSLTVSARLAMCLQPEFDQVSITVVDPVGGASPWAQDGELAIALDRLEHDLGEGPCLDSMRSAECVVAPQIRQDDRWPRYGRAAADLGVKSQVSAPLRWHDEAPLGALSMCSTTDDRVGLTAPLVAQVLAAQVASAVAALREIESLHKELARVTEKLASAYDQPSPRQA